MSDTQPSPAPSPPVPTKPFDYSRLILPIVAVVLWFATMKGWVTPDQAEAFKKEIAILQEKASHAEEAKLIPRLDGEPAVAPAREEPPMAVAAKMTTEEWAALIQQVIEAINKVTPPKPEPPPLPDPKPKPDPAPVESKIVVTDENGKAVTASTVDPGALLLVTSSGSSVGWQFAKHGAVRVASLPNNLGYAFSLDAGAWIELFLTDYAAKTQTSVRITANQGPMPPPPVPVPPNPPSPPSPPSPPPKEAMTLGLIVFSDVSSRGPDTARLLMSRYWQDLNKRHKVAVYDRSTGETVGKAFLAETAGATGDVLLIRDDTRSSKLAVIPLPKTEADFETAIKSWSTK